MNERDELQASFRSLYDEVFPVLYKVVYNIIREREASEDICQEAFIRYYNRKIPIQNADESRYWLIRVAKNLAFNLRKRKEREYRAVEKVKLESPRFAPDADDELLKDESAEAVRKALDRLPEKYRSVIILKEYGELSYKEISKILHISENNVKIRVYRARMLLEKTLNMGDFHVF